MSTWNQDNYIKVWNYASAVHNGQLVPGTEIPYINHIGLVAMEAMTALAQSDDIAFPDLLVSCALLHDTIEDTNSSFDDIQKEFGVDVANGVMALSKNKQLPSKKEQMIDSLQRIRNEPKEIWMVKLSDRITNLQPPPKHWDKTKITKYKNEATTILEALSEANNYLAERLGLKINEYHKYELITP
jgi:guanosine-3',5'-bis(diphosphate) 3'-pyrophosphohydrolase